MATDPIANLVGTLAGLGEDLASNLGDPAGRTAMLARAAGKLPDSPPSADEEAKRAKAADDLKKAREAATQTDGETSTLERTYRA
jgi:hypothetical protein